MEPTTALIFGIVVSPLIYWWFGILLGRDTRRGR